MLDIVILFWYLKIKLFFKITNKKIIKFTFYYFIYNKLIKIKIVSILFIIIFFWQILKKTALRSAVCNMNNRN